MQLKKDYYEMLERYGRLPNTVLEVKFKQMEKLGHYKQIKKYLPDEKKHKKRVEKLPNLVSDDINETTKKMT